MTSPRATRSIVATSCVALLLVGCSAGNPATGGPTAVAATSSATAVAATTRPDPTATSRRVDGAEVTTMSLGANAAPIDVVAAFGSIWVADHHLGSVSRIDPATLRQVALVDVGPGPGWFAVTDDAVWVTNQMGRGLSRIDPATNSAEVGAGDWATCGAPVVGQGYIWQPACDAGVVMQIDPETRTSTDIDLRDVAVGIAGEKVFAVGAEGVWAIDPETGKVKKLGQGQSGFPVAADDTSVWLGRDAEVVRVGLPDGKVLGRVALGGDIALTLAGDRAWLTQLGMAVHEIDTRSYELVRDLHLDRPAVAREIDGVVWVTSFDGNSLSRFEP